MIIDRACDIVALLLLGIAAVATSGWLVNLAVAGLVLLLLVGVLFAFGRAYVRGRAAADLVGRSLGIEISFLEAVFLSAVFNLGSAVPSSPGRLAA